MPLHIKNTVSLFWHKLKKKATTLNMVKKHIPPRSESGMAATDVIGLDEADKKSSKKKEGKN
jgi:hypothetical protein